MAKQFHKIVLDGRIINIPKTSRLLKRHMKLQGAKEEGEYVRNKLLQIKEKYNAKV